jgi:hypothetical protein
MARWATASFARLDKLKAYPTKSPAFRMWGKLQLARPGDSPAFSLRCSSTVRCFARP